ncbi:hypothetical protein [Kitasatospora sp. NPDC087315]|uniref:hypothetical protein n=1 Tax=Kitasatospora sp. NPDC087315 TaxID=3364069 RepID=UPI003808AE31
MADPAGIHGNPYVAGARLRYLALNDLEWPAGGGDLCNSVCTHLALSRKSATAPSIQQISFDPIARAEKGTGASEPTAMPDGLTCGWSGPASTTRVRSP